MEIKWDENKKVANKLKHGISFEDAGEIFDDPLHISILDKRFDYFEERWISLGAAKKGLVLVVGHLYYLTGEGEEVIKILTARKATNKERKQYEEIKR